LDAPTPWQTIIALAPWLGVAALWFFNRGGDWKGMDDRMRTQEDWRKEHLEDCRQRDEQIRLLSSLSYKLSAALEYSEKRLTWLENRTNGGPK
jgi:hypothetical protein